MALTIDGTSYKSLHFVGIFGIGMSAIAQFLATDCQVSGSDRAIGDNAVATVEATLRRIGCVVAPQDGSGIDEGCDAIVVSTAIEASNPDLARAAELGIPTLHRSEVLAALVAQHRTISVTGTSGKSSVSAMIFHILREAKLDPSFIGGANLHAIKDSRHLGNSWRGESDLLVIEADESDGTVVNYHPWQSIILNISKDHKEISEVEDLMQTAAAQSDVAIVNGDDARVQTLSPYRFTMSDATDIEERDGMVGFKVNGVGFTVPFPGMHTIANSLAAIAAVSQAGVSLSDASRALAEFRGVERRFDRYTEGRFTLIDDYAHNPEKVAAAIRAAKAVATPLTVLFQPHGFGPLKFLLNEFAEAFRETLTSEDRLFLLPVYYAGGTVDRSVDSTTLAALLQGQLTVATPARDDVAALIPDDQETVLLLGARDPSLPTYGNEILWKRNEADNG